MWATLIATLLPGIGKTLVDGYKAKLDSTNTRAHIDADLAARELALQQREAELQTELRKAQIGRWYEPEHLFGYVMAIYFGKVVLWDKVLGHITNGTTDPLGGDVAAWAGMIMLFYFGKRGFENVARILKR